MSEKKDIASAATPPLVEDGATGLSFDAHTRGLLGRVLRDWVAPRGRELAFAFLLMVGLATVTGCYPRLIKYAFDVLPKGDMGVMYGIAGLIILATSARALLLYLSTVATNRIVMRVTVDMQKAGVAHLLKADFARLTRDAPGELISRLTNDIAQIQVALQAALTTAVRDALTIMALVAYMVWSDPILSLIVLGVYPLADDEWSKGKCGFKAIEFMSCGVPVVAAAVGVNREIIQDGVNGFLASTEQEWMDKLGRLLADPDLRRRFGESGRRTVEERYSLRKHAPVLAATLRGVVAGAATTRTSA